MTRKRYPTFEERTAQINRDTERLNASMKTKPAAPSPLNQQRRAPAVAGRSTDAVPQVRARDSARDVPLGTGMVGTARYQLMNRQRQLDRAEEEATGERRQNYAEGGYVTKAQTMSMPACSKGKRRK